MAPADDHYFVDTVPPAERRQALSAEELAALDRINRQVTAEEALPRILDDLFESTRSFCPCDRLSLAFTEEDGQRITSRHTRAAYEPVLLQTGYSEDLLRGTLATVIRDGRVRVIRDLAAYLDRRPESGSTRLLAREGVRSSMTCPLRVEGRSVGVLFRSSRRVDAYDARHVLMHQEVAERLAHAVEKAWRIEQLRAANEAYFEMLAFVAHELKSPLASVVMDARMLTGGYLGDLEPAQTKKLEGMVRKAEFLLALVGEYLDLARLEGGQMRLSVQRDLDFVADVLSRAEEMVRAQIDGQEMDYAREVGEEPLLVDGDPTLLRIALVNLLGNAVKYGRPGGKVRVRASVEDAELRVSVWNEGPGFPPDQRPRLFRRFSRLSSPELQKRKGTGVGLYTTWRILRLHQGSIDARSEPGQWAEFSFALPRSSSTPPASETE